MRFFSAPALVDHAAAQARPQGRSRRAGRRARSAQGSFELPQTQAGRGTSRGRASCNSGRNARSPITATQLVLVTHPFHPLSGQRLACVGERYNRYGKRLLLQVDGEQICSIPPQWTDVGAPDPEIILGAGRAPLRLGDLLELADLVERLAAERSRSSRKPNYVANVRVTTPQARDGINGDPPVCRTKSRQSRKQRA